jgi:hypothetical protein
VTIATGTLSDKQRRRIERKGPPPEEFYGEVWRNGWKFLKKNWKFGVQTALVWSVCLTMASTSRFAQPRWKKWSKQVEQTSQSKITRW